MDMSKLAPGTAVPGAAGEPAMRATANGSASAAARDARLDPKLVSAAHQFEASLMAELLKPLNSDPLFGDEQESGGVASLTSESEGSGSALMSFGSEALAKALSEKGGMGIARRILDHFEANAAGQSKRGEEVSGDGGSRPFAAAKKLHPLSTDLQPLLK